MIMIDILRIINILKLTSLFISDASSSREERKLFNDLFKESDYNKHVRPVLHYNDTITVKIKHTVSQILDIEERKEIFVTSGWSSLRWTDAYLSWDPKRYNGISSINLSPGVIWLPDIMLYDDFKSNKNFGSHVDQTQNRLTINHNGQVTWGLKATFVTKCHFDIGYFPFDTQSCPFRYGSWSHEKGRIDLSPQSKIKVDYHAAHSGWDFTSHSVEMLRKNYTGGTYEFVVFKVTFKRRAVLASVNLVMPPITIGTLVLLTFVLPAASGERLALSITLLLAMIYFIIHVANLIPKDNISIPVIYKFFIATLGEIVLQIVSLIFGMQLYYKKPYDPPLPKWMKRFFLNRMSYILGTRVSYDSCETYSLDTEELESCIELGFIPKEGNNTYMNTIKKKTCERGEAYPSSNEAIILMEWRIVALTYDRCLFLIFTVIWLVTMAIYFIKVTWQQ